MIIVPVKEGENIERALKKFKRKAEKTGIIKEVRNRKQFNKPSVVKREKMQHAIYVNKRHQEEEEGAIEGVKALRNQEKRKINKVFSRKFCRLTKMS